MHLLHANIDIFSNLQKNNKDGKKDETWTSVGATSLIFRCSLTLLPLIASHSMNLSPPLSLLLCRSKQGLETAGETIK